MTRITSGGFSLIEVLVAAAIMAISVLGASAAVMTGLQSATDAEQSAMARVFAEDIQERVWLHAEGDEGECEDAGPADAGLETWSDHPLIGSGPLTGVVVRIEEADEDEGSRVDEFEFEDGELSEVEREGGGCRLVIAPREGNDRFTRLAVALNTPYGDDD